MGKHTILITILICLQHGILHICRLFGFFFAIRSIDLCVGMFLHLFTSGVLYFCISLFYSILEELLIFCISLFLLFWRTDTDVTWGIPRGLNPSFQDTYHHNDGQWKGSKRHKNSYGHIIGVIQKTFQVLIFGIETSRSLSQIEQEI